MRTLRALLPALMVVPLLALTPAPAPAGGPVGKEAWLGAGFNNPDYDEEVLAVARAGAGVVFFDRVGLGGNVQVDDRHWFGFGYATLILPSIGPFEPFGRFHAGRRDDNGETVLGWAGGLRTGHPAVKFFLEGFGITEPGYAAGICFGITF